MRPRLWLIVVLLLLPLPLLAQTGTGPDPSLLTTQQLQRENAALKELIFSKLDAITSRLDAADKAVQLLHEDVTRVPTDVDKAVSHLRELVFQKLDTNYDGVQLQFKERDIRVDQTAKDNKVAVDAALSAAKEAVGEQNKSSALAIAKQEATFNKQLEQLTLLVNTVTGGLVDKFNDLKAVVSTILGHNNGIGDSWGFAIGAIGAVGVLVSVVLLFRQQPIRTVEVVRDADSQPKVRASISS
jgi:hypothetical protein